MCKYIYNLLLILIQKHIYHLILLDVNSIFSLLQEIDFNAIPLLLLKLDFRTPNFCCESENNSEDVTFSKLKL